MPAEAVPKTARARHAVVNQRLAPVVPFLNECIAHAKPMTSDGGAPVGPHTDLRKACDFARQFLGFGARAALGRDILAQADAQAFFRRHLAPGENDLEGAPLANDTRQPDGASVDQRHAPATTIDAE